MEEGAQGESCGQRPVKFAQNTGKRQLRTLALASPPPAWVLFMELPEETDKGNSSASACFCHTHKKATCPRGHFGSHPWSYLPSHLLSVSFTNHASTTSGSSLVQVCPSYSRNALPHSPSFASVCFSNLPFNATELLPFFISSSALATNP